MQEFEKDNVKISNVAHQQYTQVTIVGEPGGNKPGAQSTSPGTD